MTGDQELLQESVRLLTTPAAYLQAPVVTPASYEEALAEIRKMEKQLSDLRNVSSSNYHRITKLESECTKYRRAYDSLRELLAAFSGAGGGWEKSALVPADAMAAYRADAGL